MAREWTDLFLLDAERAAAVPAAEPEQRGRFFRRLRQNLRRTREALGAEIVQTLFDTLDADTWERLEEALIMADCGARPTARIVGQLEQEATSGAVAGPEALQARLTELLADAARAGAPDRGDGRPGEPTVDLAARPTVIMVCGVNGTGKTTSLGKLAHVLSAQLGLDVVLGAADTFRAAAVEQLQEWGARAGVEVVTGPPESDPAAVAYEAIRRGHERGADVVLVDTAGRLHTQKPLMEELAKVKRVMAKIDPDAPHETLLTVDATTGQNGLRQAQDFSAATAVSGILLTKLDGTAKGGIAIAIAQDLGLPVKLVGLGEALEDLRPFDADDFAAALLREDERLVRAEDA